MIPPSSYRARLLLARARLLLGGLTRLKSAPICEKSFSLFFILWGGFLLLDHLFNLSHHGLFYGYLESYLPSWLWGNGFVLLGVARLAAFYLRSKFWRCNLALVTFILLTLISSVALYTRLWAATAPLALFATYISFWCYRSTLRDVNLGL